MTRPAKPAALDRPHAGPPPRPLAAPPTVLKAASIKARPRRDLGRTIREHLEHPAARVARIIAATAWPVAAVDVLRLRPCGPDSNPTARIEADVAAASLDPFPVVQNSGRVGDNFTPCRIARPAVGGPDFAAVVAEHIEAAAKFLKKGERESAAPRRDPPAPRRSPCCIAGVSTLAPRGPGAAGVRCRGRTRSAFGCLKPLAVRRIAPEVLTPTAYPAALRPHVRRAAVSLARPVDAADVRRLRIFGPDSSTAASAEKPAVMDRPQVDVDETAAEGGHANGRADNRTDSQVDVLNRKRIASRNGGTRARLAGPPRPPVHAGCASWTARATRAKGGRT